MFRSLSPVVQTLPVLYFATKTLQQLAYQVLHIPGIHLAYACIYNSFYHIISYYI